MVTCRQYDSVARMAAPFRRCDRSVPDRTVRRRRSVDAVTESDARSCVVREKTRVSVCRSSFVLATIYAGEASQTACSEPTCTMVLCTHHPYLRLSENYALIDRRPALHAFFAGVMVRACVANDVFRSRASPDGSPEPC